MSRDLSYMELRAAKSAIQDAKELELTAGGGDGTTAQRHRAIFVGLVFWLNGDVASGAVPFKRAVAERGGSWELNMSSRVTHVVTRHISLSWRRRLAAPGRRSSEVWVSPDWVHACIAANEVVPTQDYLPDGWPLAESRQLPWQPLPQRQAKAAAPVAASSSSARQPSARPSLIIEDPAKYLAQYWSQSRLHHIASWKAEFAEEAARTLGSPDALPVPGVPLNDPGRVYMYLDMDCFFASVAVRDNPVLCQPGVPVGVTHGRNDLSVGGGSDLASVNYAARALGIANGDWLQDALRKCPDLVTLPYDFPAYHEAALAVLHVLTSLEGASVLPLSCDESITDITNTTHGARILATSFDIDECVAVGRSLQEQVSAATRGLPCSVGIGPTMLLAKMACSRGKPAGVGVLSHATAHQLLLHEPVSKLPGVGRSAVKKLKSAQLTTIGQVRAATVVHLQQLLGDKLGMNASDLAHGRDVRELRPAARQSVSADCNFGVRLQTDVHLTRLLVALAEEVVRRLVRAVPAAGTTKVQLTLLRARGAWREPSKTGGHGLVHRLTRFSRLASATCSSAAVAAVACALARVLEVPASEVRGAGIMLSDFQELTVGDAPARGDGAEDDGGGGRRGRRRNVAGVAAGGQQLSLEQVADRQREAGSRPRGVTLAEVLPSPSQIDQSVWAAIPTQERRAQRAALARMYGRSRPSPPAPAVSSPASLSSRKPHVVELPETPATPADAVSRAARRAGLDPDVLRDLPPALRAEALARPKNQQWSGKRLRSNGATTRRRRDERKHDDDDDDDDGGGGGEDELDEEEDDLDEDEYDEHVRMNDGLASGSVRVVRVRRRRRISHVDLLDLPPTQAVAMPPAGATVARAALDTLEPAVIAAVGVDATDDWDAYTLIEAYTGRTCCDMATRVRVWLERRMDEVVDAAGWLTQLLEDELLRRCLRIDVVEWLLRCVRRSAANYGYPANLVRPFNTALVNVYAALKELTDGEGTLRLAKIPVKRQ